MSTCLLAVGLSAVAAAPAVAETARPASARIAGPLVLADAAGNFIPVTTPSAGPGGGVGVGQATKSLASATAAASRFSLPSAGQTGFVRAADKCLTHIPSIALVSCDPNDAGQAYETSLTGGRLHINLPGLASVVLGASASGLSFAEKGATGTAQMAVGANFEADESVEPPAAPPTLENVFAFGTAGAAIVGGKADPGATISVRHDGDVVASTTIGARDRLFGIVARGVDAQDELTVTATTKDGRESTTTATVAPHDEGPVSAQEGTLENGSVTITGRGTPGAEILISGLIDPSAVSGTTVVGPNGDYTVTAKVAAKAARATAELLVKVTQSSTDGAFDTYLRVTGADDLTYAVPSVFSAAHLPADERLLGFSADADGYLTATAHGAYEDAAGDATTLVYTFDKWKSITDETGEKCLTVPVRSADDQRPRLLDCDNGSDQEWSLTEDGAFHDINGDRGLTPVEGSTRGSWTMQATGNAGHWMTIVAPQVFSEQLDTKVELTDSTLRFRGEASPLSTVLVTAKINGLVSELVRRDIDETGSWSATLPASVLKFIPDARVSVSSTYLTQKQNVEFDFDAKNVVTIAGLEDGDVISGGSTTIDGTALAGKKVVVKEGDDVLGEAVAEGSPARAAGDEGTYSIPLTSLAPGEHTFTVVQSQNDNATTRSTVTVEVEAAIASPTVETPAAESTVSVSRPVFTGKGEPQSTVTIGYGAKSTIGRTTVKDDGSWTIELTAGLSLGKSSLIVTQKAGADTQTTTHMVNRVVEAAGLAVTSHKATDVYSDGIATFSGTGEEGAAVSAKNQWGTPMGSATVKNGTWAFTRNLGPTSAGYDIVFTQTTKGADAKTVTVHLDHEAKANVPVAVSSIADGATYKPGLNILRGTGTPNATVSAVNATNGWNVPMGTAKVDADGTWTLPERNWGPSNDYQIKVTQTNPDKTTSTVTVAIKAPVTR